jgi:hypothetical protein
VESGEVCQDGQCVFDEPYCWDGCCYYDECCYYDDGGGSCYYDDCFDDFDCGPEDVCSYGSCETIPGLTDCPAELIPLTLAAAGTEEILSLAFMDANGDAAQDLVVGRSSGLELLLGPGDDPFLTLPSPADAAVTDLVTADVDGDGDPDIIAADDAQGGRLTIVSSDGQGGFALASETSGLGMLRGLVTLDFDGNGTMDIAADASGVPIVLLGDGNGGVASTMSLQTLAGIGGLAAGNFNGDMQGDLAVHVEPSTAFWFGGNRAVPFADHSLLDVWPRGPRQLIATDFDGGGGSELIGYGPIADGWTLLETRRDGTDAWHGNALPHLAAAAAHGDIDGDAVPDVVFASTGWFSIAFGSPARTESPFLCRATTASEASGEIVAVGDLDGDGRADIALSVGSSLTVLSVL